jgi:hypothetical protein
MYPGSLTLTCSIVKEDARPFDISFVFEELAWMPLFSKYFSAHPKDIALVTLDLRSRYFQLSIYQLKVVSIPSWKTRTFHQCDMNRDGTCPVECRANSLTLWIAKDMATDPFTPAHYDLRISM